MANDPFAAEPDEAQAETNPEPAADVFGEPPEDAPKKAAPKKAPARKASTKKLADDEDDPEFWPFTLSLKGHPGFDAPLLVIRGKSVSDLADQFEGEDGAEVRRLMDKASRAAKYFSELFPEDRYQTKGNNFGGGGSGNRAAKTDDRKKPPRGVETPECRHGQMIYKSGVSKRGNAYELFECPDGKCKSEWLN